MSHEDPFASRSTHPPLPAAAWVVLAIAAPLALLLSVIGALSLAAVSSTVSARAEEIRAGAGAGAGFSGTEGWPEPEAEPEPEVEPEPFEPSSVIGLDDAVDFGTGPAWSLERWGDWEQIPDFGGNEAYASSSANCEVHLRANPKSAITAADLDNGRRGASAALAEAMIVAHVYSGARASESTRTEDAPASGAIALAAWHSDDAIEFAQREGGYTDRGVEHVVTSLARKDLDGEGGYAAILVDCEVAPGGEATPAASLTRDFVLDFD
ncbi:hypothetical protein M3147_11570 [Agromyces mediolanus]|uniref:hypothetical protein n=1 Tax=Agromyces mediolanus TaxID=41986 RepID=UPI00203E2254|nr:hypothetical protein [Agromyces mediolanus]MCM3657890.1 hypothetical protein [Agromyces mediolanus]